MGILLGKATLPFLFCFPFLNGRQLLNKKVLLKGQSFFPLREGPFCEGNIFNEANRMSWKLFPFVKMAENPLLLLSAYQKTFMCASLFFKVQGYTFRESNSAIFIFVSNLIRGQLLNKRICSPGANSFLKE